MNQRNIARFTTPHIQMYLVVFLLIICTNTHSIFAYDTYDRSSWQSNDQEKVFAMTNGISDDIQLTRRGVWSRLFRQEYNPSRANTRAHYSPTAPVNTYQIGSIHLIPYDKRTIPIELQKALYAHGIVGRRRRRRRR